jgi:predicted RNase H-like nuclease (RuvC/YqgF family)
MLDGHMTDPGEKNPESAKTSGRSGPPRRGRRGGRGRGRGRGPVAGVSTESAKTADAPESPAPPEAQTEAAPIMERVEQITRNVISSPTPDSSGISKAIDQITEIIEHLKRTVDQMEEVLELVELAERQKMADEREIDSLRRQLNRMHRPREQFERHGQGQPRERERGDHREHREPRERQEPQEDKEQPEEGGA